MDVKCSFDWGAAIATVTTQHDAEPEEAIMVSFGRGEPAEEFAFSKEEAQNLAEALAIVANQVED